ncbi:hypothetical protein SLEP1_g19505 [Rubroshorea leprosula]|uniref:Reverse transcriptase domain-containing protein n=1 Tax=Rubroshorea leprosula TaxID=152421 RepID=A0AAV5J8K1_9ROSI|nr:hypothetical protein SLEP1_g19505 [Rubroshorea leprosula]
MFMGRRLAGKTLPTPIFLFTILKLNIGGARQPVDEPGDADGEEDDVERGAGESNGNVQLQDLQDGDRSTDVVPDSIENFENFEFFEFSKEGVNRDRTTDLVQKGGNDVADAGSKNEGGCLLGLVEQNNRMSYGEVVKKGVGSDRGPNGEDSGLIAMGQDTRKGESPLSIGRNTFSGNDAECSGQKAGERRGTLESRTPRCRGSREGKRGRGAGASSHRGGQMLPEFIANPNGAAAGESVGDSGIQNCNRSIKRKMQRKLAKEIWELAKQLGATADCDEEVICRIDEMEKRDSLAKAVTVKKAAGSAKKRALWEELHNLILNRKGNWCLGGDFNAVRSAGERAGCKGMSREMIDFDRFISESGLVDLPMVGRKYTWYNANGKYMSRIDRFLVSEEWLMRWCDVKQWGLERTVSDHCPVLLKHERVDWGPKPFKIFDAWLQEPGCKEIIRNTWNSTTVEGWYGFKLKEKLKTFSEEEIKNAVWDCESSKSPGPDGFNFKFVKCMWEDIKSEIAGFIREFQEHGRLVRGSNASFITLIPKVENPQRIEEYRPISLIGVMYKIIAKLLANRLRKVLDKVIGEQQMAFIEGRQLVDGVVIANEVIDEAKRNKKRSFLFKVDFEKAYDKVCWDFLDYMLLRMGFCNTWRMWIRECLQSNTVSVLVNGSPSRQFSVSKGLRQGDPLSPFLFLIVAEGLNGLMSSAVEKELYKGVTVGKDAVMITHLQFADDTIFFGDATENNIMVIKSIMRSFELLSGLKINLQKSQLMGINVEDSWGCKMAYRLCCKKGEFPFKYLGIPIGGSHRRLTMWQPLLESFKKKLSSWKGRQGRQLSLGGRITLINSVLSSLPVFLMSVYLLPKGTLKAIDKIRKSFLWGGEGERKRINWVNWKKVCMPKECGGLGVRDLEHFNLSLMGKWWGRLAAKEDGLWRKVIASKYGEGGRHWMDWVRNGVGACSCWWRDVRRIDNVEGEITGWLTEGFSLKLGEGKGVSFWWDEWSRGFCLANKFPRLYLLSEGKEKECCQMGSMCNGTWKWNITWRRKLLEREEEAAKELSIEIEGVKIAPGRPDEWEWIHSKDSRYSTKTAYSLLTKVPRCPTQERVFKRVWNPNLPTKISAFNWQLLLNRLPTKSNLLKRGFSAIMGDGKCSLCQEEEEDATHLFLKCKNRRWIWKECDRWWGINIEPQEDCWKTFEHLGTWTRNTRIRKGWDCTWSAIVWSIWLMRNQRIFQNQEMDPGKLLDLVQIRSFLWFKAKKAWCYFTLSDWISNPIACLTEYCGGKS